MKRLIVVLVLLAFVGLVALRVTSAIHARDSMSIGTPPPPVVSVARVLRTDFPQVVKLSGTLRPKVQVDVYAKTGGRLLEVSADLGSRVEKGQVLAVIEHEEMKWQAKQAQAAVSVAKAQVDGARLEFERTQSLHKSGALPQAALDGSKIKLDLALAQLEQAKAAAGLAESAVSNFTIRAPLSGVISRRLAEEGAMAGSQLPLFSIQDSSELELATTVDAAGFALLEVGQKATLRSDDIPGATFDAEVSRLAPALDPMTRRAEVVLSLSPESREGRKLLPNVFARGEIRIGTRAATLAVPLGAVLEGLGGERSLMRFEQDSSTVSVLPVHFAEQHEGLIAVIQAADSGALELREGDWVVVDGQSRLTHGALAALASPEVATRAKTARQDGSPEQQKQKADEESSASPDL